MNFCSIVSSLHQWLKQIQCVPKRAGCEEGCWEGVSPWLLETESMEKNKVMTEGREKDYSAGNLKTFDMLHSFPSGKNCLRFILYSEYIRMNLHSPLATFFCIFWSPAKFAFINIQIMVLLYEMDPATPCLCLYSEFRNTTQPIPYPFSGWLSFLAVSHSVCKQNWFRNILCLWFGNHFIC